MNVCIHEEGWKDERVVAARPSRMPQTYTHLLLPLGRHVERLKRKPVVCFSASHGQQQNGVSQSKGNMRKPPHRPSTTRTGETQNPRTHRNRSITACARRTLSAVPPAPPAAASRGSLVVLLVEAGSGKEAPVEEEEAEAEEGSKSTCSCVLQWRWRRWWCELSPAHSNHKRGEVVVTRRQTDRPTARQSGGRTDGPCSPPAPPAWGRAPPPPRPRRCRSPPPSPATLTAGAGCPACAR